MTFTLGAPIARLSQNFDGVVAPALPPGWTATNSATSQPPTWVDLDKRSGYAA